MAESINGRPGRYARAALKLAQIDSYVATFLAAKTILDAITLNPGLTRTAVSVGRAIEDEMRFLFYHEEKPAYYDVIMRDQMNRKEPSHHRRRMSITR